MANVTVTLGGEDITSAVEMCDITVGFSDPLSHVADIGTCTLTVHNDDRRFSPNNTASPLHSVLRPGAVVTVAESTTMLFRGFVRSIVPEAGQFDGVFCVIECCDLLGRLQDYLVSLPLQEGKSADYLLRLITSAVLRGQRATGTVTFSGAAAVNDTVTVGDVVYTFKGAPAAPYEVKAGGAGAAAENLAAAINAAGTEFVGAGAYGTDTERHPQVSAEAEVLAGESGGSTNIEPVYLEGSPIGRESDGREYQTAQQFEVASGTLLQLEFYIKSKVGNPGTLTWEVCTDVADTPGEVLQSGTFTPNLDQWTVVPVANGVSLFAGTKYWVKLRITTLPAKNNYWLWSFGPSVVPWPSADKYGTAPWYVFWIYDSSVRITTGEVTDCYVHLTANARGAWGNDVALAASGANIAVSGAALAGGGDEPAGYIDFDTGQAIIDIAADSWREDETNALTAMTDVAESEFGYIWCARDGTLTFRDRLLPFRLANSAPDMEIDDEHNIQDTALSLDDLANRVTVSYMPRRTTTSGVIARANTVLEVPGRWGADVGSSNFTRWNPSDLKTQAEGARTYTLPFVDVGTGKISGARSLVLPLVAGVDYTVNDAADGSGFNYTYTGRVKFSVAVTGSGVEVHMTNTALGTLYVRDLQIRGEAYIAYEPLTITIDDMVSQDDFGQRALSVTIPLQVQGGGPLAEQIGRYILRRYAQPETRVALAGFGGIEESGGVSLWSIEIGDVVELSETQTVLSGLRHWVMGISYSFVAGAPPVTTLQLATLGEKTYLTLDDEVYGLLDRNYLAL